MLTSEQIQQLAIALGHGQGSFTEDDLVRACKWAECILIDHGLLSVVLDGDAGIDFRGDEPAFAPTDKGRARVQALIADSGN